ncbi:MAG: hypothetical protein WA840_03000 [Caulobacteraceae bacterium]
MTLILFTQGRSHTRTGASANPAASMPYKSDRPAVLLFGEGLAKALAVGRAGLTLCTITDRNGHVTRRWMRTCGTPVRRDDGALVSGAGPAAGSTVVSPAQLDAFMASNGAAMGRLAALKTQLSTLSAQLAQKEGHELESPSRAKAARTLLDGKLADVDREIGLRTDAMRAIAASKAGPGGAGTDPAVAGPVSRLMQGKAVSSSPPDMGKLQRQLARIQAYDVASWARYHRWAGPAFPERSPSDPRFTLAGSPALAEAIKAKRLTGSEGDVLVQMSHNEGRFDSVQAYDSQIVTAGVMQKTVNPKGAGELSKQIWSFSQSHPQEYQRLFAQKGWTVAKTGKGAGDDDYTLSFQDPGDPHAKPMTGPALYAYIKDKAHPDNWARTLSPLQQAGRDPVFQAQQVDDFQARLHEAIDQKPLGYAWPIRDYLTSEKGVALVLDESVNAQSRVGKSFGQALHAFYAANPSADRDPTRWSSVDRGRFEPQIVRAYEAAREQKRTMTNPAKRYQAIEASSLSGAPGSFVRSVAR